MPYDVAAAAAPLTPMGATALPVETRVAVHSMSIELRQLEATAAVAAAAHGGGESADGMTQLALRHEIELLQGHLHVAARRTETLQATLEQRELELQRAHAQLCEHMRQSGAMLASLANMHQNLVPQPVAQPAALGMDAATTTPR
jgi:hypothetical protein